MALTLHHVGIASHDAARTAADFEKMLGISLGPLGLIDHRDQGVKFGLAPAGAALLEFLEPYDPPPGHHARRLKKHLDERGEGLFHLSLFSDDYDADIGRLRELGYEIDEDHLEFVGGTRLRVSFIDPKDAYGVWIEICDAAGVPDNMR